MTSSGGSGGGQSLIDATGHRAPPFHRSTVPPGEDIVVTGSCDRSDGSDGSLGARQRSHGAARQLKTRRFKRGVSATIETVIPSIHFSC